MKKFLILTTAVAFGMLFNSSFSQASETLDKEDRSFQDVTESPEFHRAARQLIVGVVDSKTFNDEWVYQPISLDPDKEWTSEVKGAFEISLHDREKVTFILRTLRHCMLEGDYAQDADDQPFKMTSTASDFHKFIEEQLPIVFQGEEKLLENWCAAVQWSIVPKDKMDFSEKWRSVLRLSFSAPLMLDFSGETQENYWETEILKKFQSSSLTSSTVDKSFWGQINEALKEVRDEERSLTPQIQTCVSSSPSPKGDSSFLKELDEEAFETKLHEEAYPLTQRLKTLTVKKQVIPPLSVVLSSLDAPQQKEYIEDLASIRVLVLNNSLAMDENISQNPTHPVPFTLKLGGKGWTNLQGLGFIQGEVGQPEEESLQEIYDGNPKLKYLTLANLEEAHWKKLREEAGDNKDGFIKEGASCEDKKALYFLFKDRA